MKRGNLLSKTDYLRYLESPMHLWAYKHDRLENEHPSEHALLLMEQGRQVEGLAQGYLSRKIGQEHPEAEIHLEMELTDEHYIARLDAAVFYPAEDVWDIYEIKSGNSISKNYRLDAAFQRLVAAANLKVRDTYIMHLNKQYRREGEIDLEGLFVIENVNQQIRDLCEELRASRESAWAVMRLDSTDKIEACLKPNVCPCPRLCHPNLPEYPIYDLPRIGKKARELRAAGITAIEDIPPDFNLTYIQASHAEVVARGEPIIDAAGVKSILDKMVFPLYFLDYETFNPANPRYDGYSPHQQMVFQYSLHVFESPEAEPVHYEYLATGKEEPSLGLAADLLERIGPTGSVVVWFKGFESSRTMEMADRHPQFAGRLNSIIERIFDLRDVFSDGFYLHPDFHGSSSIKNVLPVMVPDLTYEGMAVPSGTAAMQAWAKMMSGELDSAEFEQTVKDLLAYCKLDTWAMVRIWQVLLEIISISSDSNNLATRTGGWFDLTWGVKIPKMRTGILISPAIPAGRARHW